MPIYEYYCPRCNIEFEVRRTFDESDKPGVCPKCQSKAERLVSGFGSKTGSYVRAPGKPFRQVPKKASKRK